MREMQSAVRKVMLRQDDTSQKVVGLNPDEDK